MSYLNIDKIPESDFEFEQKYAALMIPHYRRNRFLELIKKGYAAHTALRIMEQQDQLSGRTGEGKKKKKKKREKNKIKKKKKKRKIKRKKKKKKKKKKNSITI